jgi:hypothetical protein
MVLGRSCLEGGERGEVTDYDEIVRTEEVTLPTLPRPRRHLFGSVKEKWHGCVYSSSPITTMALTS